MANRSQGMTSPLDLPPEILLIIASFLNQTSKKCLSNTCQYFRAVLGFLPRPDSSAIYKFNLERELKDPLRERRTCSKCLRLRRFFHFSKKHARACPRPNSRKCMDCLEPTAGIGQIFMWVLDTAVTRCPHCLQIVVCDTEDKLFVGIPSHEGRSQDTSCARNFHRVPLWGKTCPLGCRHFCHNCHQHCGICKKAMFWEGGPCCGTVVRTKNHLEWDVPEQSPSSPEKVVDRLRAVLDRVWPPPSKDDFNFFRGRHPDCSIEDIVETLLHGEPDLRKR